MISFKLTNGRLQYAFVALATIALTACGKTVVHDRPVRVSVPVAQSCALPRPAPVPSLAVLFPNDVWNAMDVRQKAAAVGKWALDLRSYGEQLNAATAACP